MAPQATSDEQRLEIIKRICGLIIQSSVEKACKEVGIAESTFYAWVASDETLAEEYARARVAIAYKDEVGIEKIVEQTERGEIDPAAARVAIDGRKWLAGKRNPKVYGDKLDVTSKDKEISSVVVVASADKQKRLEEL